MAIFAGNPIFKISIPLRNRVFPISWVRKTSAICCSRTYGSSGPVRYIPQKYRKIEESFTSPSMKIDKGSDSSVRDEVSQYGRPTGRVLDLGEKSPNQFYCADRSFDADTEFLELKDESKWELEVLDDEFLVEPEEVIDELKMAHDNDPFDKNAKGTSKTKEDAVKCAIEALATRAFTAVELRKKLHGKRFPHDIIERVISDLQNRGLINDYLYAETFSRSRWSSSTWGPKRINQVLRRKGVSEADIEKAVKVVFQEGDYDGDLESNLGMSKLSIDRLFVQASKQWLRGQNVTRETQKSRIIRWLQYRGFNWGVTSFILKKLETQYPP